ncbi:hypothetical protein [Enterobacter hormaechei]|uniref:hypothetical protein n=1 Tax=Enterobacter hormaechei TaxID=158836 RepID=UPI0012539728|nr:hypothetical protein [Enterobacter hormaechei]HCI5436964.1 hypothetical protein [Enterobacter roggenkampii]HDW0462077.1 hypothetical protein [Enterobacter hormaechei subsp. xiangfangensis]VAE12540.1 Uncharacterised protein [Enterobacter hormaechei]VAF53691.1 Uncharacterised protein [Enterobacter hormaechei]HEC1398715.1 hypothetical protein [Enterobacter hormaechei]
MEEFEGTPGVWDIDINDQTVLSDAGYKVADIDLIHGTISDVFVMVAAPELLEQLIETHSALCFTPDYLGSLRYEKNKAAIAKALGK